MVVWTQQYFSNCSKYKLSSKEKTKTKGQILPYFCEIKVNTGLVLRLYDTCKVCFLINYWIL